MWLKPQYRGRLPYNNYRFYGSKKNPLLGAALDEPKLDHLLQQKTPITGGRPSAAIGVYENFSKKPPLLGASSPKRG